MIEFVHKQRNKNLILFIHGLTGSNETWKNEETGKTFPLLLLEDNEIYRNFDIAYFEYFTHFFNIKPRLRSLLSLITRDKSTPKNLSVQELSSLLQTRIEYELIEYDNIVLIAHSMGGLIAKRTILDNIFKGNSKIKLFLSLAVPHLGSDLAVYADFVSSNIQIEDLRPLSNETIELLNKWLKTSNLPTTKYFVGAYEGTVPMNSAIPPSTNVNDILSINENHRTISKPKDKNSIVVISTIKILKDFLKNVKVDDIDYDKIMSEEYNDEYFVLKLFIADVHTGIIKDSKQHFYYAEAIRKIFTSTNDKQILRELYAKIDSLYRNLYGDFVSKKISTSTELVNEVHKKIIEEDKEFLDVTLPKLNGLHKKGMIHQLANDMNRNITWNENVDTVETLDILKNFYK